jgi:hypothetical protein
MSHNAKPQPVVWWILWATFMAGVFLFYSVLGDRGTQAETPSSDSRLWWVGFVPFGVSTLLRWLVLPRLRNATTALPVFVLGIAMAEFCCFLGLFIFPAHKQDLFLLCVLGLAQYVPVFAGRFSNLNST